MQLLECRFRKDQAVIEALFFAIASLMATAPFADLVDDRLHGFPENFLPGTVLGVLFLSALTWARWRSRIVLDDQGVEWRRSRRSAGSRLSWEEIDEFFLTGGATFELRGAGGRIRFTGYYEDVSQARDLCLPRLSGMRDLLRSRAFRDGSLVFRMPGGRWRAHAAYLAAVLILSGVTWYCLATLLGRRFNGLPFVLLFFGGSWLWGLRRRASGMGTRVTLHRQGLLVRRLDGKDRVSWDALDRTQWNSNGGLDLVLRSRRVISLPPALGNIGLLEEFIQEGRASVDFEARGQAGGRTIMQSP
jgi:hypothetical protein